MSEDVKEGDWVTSYSSGIWQVYRVLRFKEFDPVTGLEQERARIFSKRFLLKSFKRSFKEECCDPFFVELLDQNTRAKLESFIKTNEALYRKFLEFSPKPIHCIYNARIIVAAGQTPEKIERLIPRGNALRQNEIKPLLESLGIAAKVLPSWTAQFVSRDHACQDGYLMYEFSRVLTS